MLSDELPDNLTSKKVPVPVIPCILAFYYCLYIFVGICSEFLSIHVYVCMYVYSRKGLVCRCVTPRDNPAKFVL